MTSYHTDRENLRHQIRQLQENGKTVVFTNGCFDILHVGHVTYLDQAKALGDILVVGLNSDASVRRLKGPTRPIHSEKDRATVLAALRAVDFVSIFDEDTPISLILDLKPNIHTKGGDYDAKQLPEYTAVHSYGGKIHILPFVEGKSTTDTLRKLSDI